MEKPQMDKPLFDRDARNAILACVVLSLAVFVGSTGLGYAVYRPLRYYDIFSLVISWLGLGWHLWRARRAG